MGDLGGPGVRRTKQARSIGVMFGRAPTAALGKQLSRDQRRLDAHKLVLIV